MPYPIRNPFQLPKRLARPQPLWSGRIEPSGRFSLGNTPKKLPSNNAGTTSHGKAKLCELQPQDSCLVSPPDDGQGSLCDMSQQGGKTSREIGSSNSVNSRKRGSRGCRGIGGAASAQLAYWLGEFERRHGRGLISFVTLTVPEGGKEWRREIQENWAEIVKGFVEELKREIKRRKGPCTAVLGCTEIQEQRSKKYGWSVPHLHLVFRGKRRVGSDWIFSPVEIRGIWRRVIGRFIDVSDCDFRAAENVQRVKRSCARYLAKYLSKSSSKNRSTVGGCEWHPNSYVILPRAYRRWYRANSRAGESIAMYILGVMRERHLIDGFYMRPITLPTRIDVHTGERFNEVVIGWVGYNPDWVEHAPDSVLDAYE